MLQNYLKVMLRHLFKRKSYALINTLGLAIGMAGCLLIAQYVTFEESYDGFHEQADRIYRLSYSKEKSGVRSFDSALTYAGVGSLMKNTFPEVQEVARLLPSRGLISTESSVFEEQDLYFADPSYLTMFSLPLLRGDHATALDHPYNARDYREEKTRNLHAFYAAIKLRTPHGKLIELGGLQELQEHFKYIYTFRAILAA